MGWSIGFDANWNRDIGYSVRAYCDEPKCTEEIDRGIAHVCGGEPYGGERGCGLYFCATHLFYHKFKDGETQCVCHRCDTHKKPFKPKPEHPEWAAWKLTHSSWADWRKKHPKDVHALLMLIRHTEDYEKLIQFADEQGRNTGLQQAVDAAESCAPALACPPWEDAQRNIALAIRKKMNPCYEN